MIHRREVFILFLAITHCAIANESTQHHLRTTPKSRTSKATTTSWMHREEKYTTTAHPGHHDVRRRIIGETNEESTVDQSVELPNQKQGQRIRYQENVDSNQSAPLQPNPDLMAVAINTFRSMHSLKQDTDVSLIYISDTNIVTLNGKEYELDNLEPMSIYAHGASFTLDGISSDLPPLSESLTFTGNIGGDTVMITKGYDGEILTMDIMGVDGSDEYLAAVLPGVLAKINPEDLDPDILKALNYDDIAAGGDPSNRTLKKAPLPLVDNHDRTHLEEQKSKSVAESDSSSYRALQSGGSCSSFRIIEVAIAYESTFCALLGGANAANREVEQIVSRASLLYQQQGVCINLAISHMEGFCTESSDPYKPLVDVGHIGCTYPSGLLQEFQTYWRDNRESVHRDAAHLFFGKDYPGDTVGCSFGGALCSSHSGYGVNDMAFSSDQLRRSVIFAHELGHNIGLAHATNENEDNYIMSSVMFGTHIWSPQSLDELENLLPSHSCIDVVGGNVNSGYDDEESIRGYLAGDSDADAGNDADRGETGSNLDIKSGYRDGRGSDGDGVDTGSDGGVDLDEKSVSEFEWYGWDYNDGPGEEKHCGCSSCTSSVLDQVATTSAGRIYSCRDYIEWAQLNLRLSELEACSTVGDFFPSTCGQGCHPDYC